MGQLCHKTDLQLVKVPPGMTQHKVLKVTPYDWENAGDSQRNWGFYEFKFESFQKAVIKELVV